MSILVVSGVVVVAVVAGAAAYKNYAAKAKAKLASVEAAVKTVAADVKKV
jgi:cytochrome bd-type quinol oxidase subunit 1